MENGGKKTCALVGQKSAAESSSLNLAREPSLDDPAFQEPSTDDLPAEVSSVASPTYPAHALSETLPGLIESLEALCRDAEPDFVRLGRKLETIHTEAAAMSRQTLETVRRIGGESEDSVLVSLRFLARGSLAELGNCRAQVAGNLGRINVITEDLGKLHRTNDMIQKIATSLRVVGLNIGVESARTRRASDMFTVVFQQTQQLAEKILNIAESIHEDLRTTRTGQVAAHTRISDGLNQLERLSDDAQRAVRDAVREISQLMARTQETLEQIGSHTREISLQVGEVVMGIQIHDSMSQRVRHVTHALHDVEAILATPSETTGTERPDIAYAMTDIQCAQLRQTISEINDVHQRSAGAFERIQSEIDRLAHSISYFSDAERKAGPVTEFTALKTALLNLHQIIAQVTRLAMDIQETSDHASDTAARLAAHAEHVRTVSFETHLVALNAIVKAAHLGEDGRALEVLAQEVKRLSDQSNQFVGHVTKTLEAISTSVQEVQRGEGRAARGEEQAARGEGKTASGERQAARGEGKTASGEGKAASGHQSSPLTHRRSSIDAHPSPLAARPSPIDAGLREMSLAYEQFKAESLAASQYADRLRRLISKAIADLRFLPGLSERLTHHLRQLEGVRGSLDMKERQDSPRRSAAQTERLAERYTMQREREIHKQVIVPDTLCHKKDEDKEHGKGTYDDEEDLGDNVELF